MSEWAMKRFWTATEVMPEQDGFAVKLDGRGVKTPAKASLVLPTRAYADAVAAEWEAQTDKVDPLSMPFTRTANAAIDKLSVQHAEVADMLAAYGDSDLLCYRADAPQPLVDRQAAAWDPLLDWAADTFGARLLPRQGVMHAPQDPAALAALANEVHKLDAFGLAAFHDLVSMTGSLILGLAVIRRAREADQVWSLSRIDEDWQIEQWGEDEEARDTAAHKRLEFLHAAQVYTLSRPNS